MQNPYDTMNLRINSNHLPPNQAGNNLGAIGAGPPGSLHRSIPSNQGNYVAAPPYAPGTGRGMQMPVSGPPMGGIPSGGIPNNAFMQGKGPASNMLSGQNFGGMGAPNMSQGMGRGMQMPMPGPPMGPMSRPLGGIPNNGPMQGQNMGPIPNMPPSQNFGGMSGPMIPQGMGPMGKMLPSSGPGMQQMNPSQMSFPNSELSSINSTNSLIRPTGSGPPSQPMLPGSMMPPMPSSNAIPLPGSNLPPFPSANIPVPPKPGNMPNFNGPSPPISSSGILNSNMSNFFQSSQNAPMPVPMMPMSNVPMPPMPPVPPKSNFNVPMPPVPQLPNSNPQMFPVNNSSNVPMPPLPGSNFAIPPMPPLNFGQFSGPPLPPVPGGMPNRSPSGPIVPGNFPVPLGQNNNLLMPGIPQIPQKPQMPQMPQMTPGPGLSNVPLPPGPNQRNPMAEIIPMPPNFSPMQGNFPSPQMNQPNPMLSISSSEASISIRIPLSNEASKPENQNFIAYNAQANLPNSRVFNQSAGPGQASIIVLGPRHEVEYSSHLINSIDPHGLMDNQWYYLDENGEFIPYTSNQSCLIECAFRENKSEFTIEGHYHIKFGGNDHPHTQFSEKGYIHRTVRRGLTTNFTRYAPSDIIWYWTNDSGTDWNRYEPEASKLIEYYYGELKKEINISSLNNMSPGQRANLSKSKSVLVFGTGRFCYLIDLVNMAQLNEKTARWRGIRRGENGGTLRISKFGKKNDPIPWIPRYD